MPYLQLDPLIQLYYQLDDWTDPWTRRDSVVLIHGFTESTEAWRPWVPHLGRRYRIIRYDQHGFGQSSAVTHSTEFTTQGFVEAAARMIATLAGGSAHVVGAKSGGLVAIDPSPCLGDPAFDAVDLVFFGAEDVCAIESRAEALGSRRIFDWCIAFAPMAALERAERGDEPEPFLSLASRV